MRHFALSFMALIVLTACQGGQLTHNTQSGETDVYGSVGVSTGTGTGSHVGLSGTISQ